jgi:hypothetical protein
MGRKTQSYCANGWRKIADAFWIILEKFSADYIFFYRKTWYDIQISDPGRFQTFLQTRIQSWEEQMSTAMTPQDRERVETETRNIVATQFGPAVDLCGALADRLVPFHYEQRFSSIQGSSIPHELSGIVDVLPYINGQPTTARSLAPDRQDFPN